MQKEDKELKQKDFLPDKIDATEGVEDVNVSGNTPSKKTKKSPIRRAMRILLGILAFLMLLPALIYVPPIQSFLKDTACALVSDATGMQISIEKFRLRFPLDVSLRGVVVVEASGDTMVRAQEAIVDLKLKPLFDLDISPKTLKLKEGMYRMVSPDSSMVLKAEIDELTVGDASKVSLKNSVIDLDKAVIDGGQISLNMDVWKAKPEPEDENAAKWLIKIKEAELKDVGFSMSMLPTIEALDVRLGHTSLKDGIIDLQRNKISASYLSTEDGDLKYFVPTADYVASHPAPKDTSERTSKPMVIVADSVTMRNYRALYATKGVVPQNGFDASYIEADSVNVEISGMRIDGSNIVVPLRHLSARERCGLAVTQGEGVLEVGDNGIGLDDFRIKTECSSVYADADVAYSLMAMEKSAPIEAIVSASIGWGDIYCFMPSVKDFVKGVPTHNSLDLELNVGGNLSDVVVDVIDVRMKDYLSLTARGEVQNPLDVNRLSGYLDLNGVLSNSSLVNQIAYGVGVNVPTFSIDGRVDVVSGNYSADLEMLTEYGDVVLDGELNLNKEDYYADLRVSELQLNSIMPSLGLGVVGCELHAQGSGFNPADNKAWSEIMLNVEELEYDGVMYNDIELSAMLEDGNFDIDLVSYNPYADVDIKAVGRIAERYEADVKAQINYVDLRKLGLTDEVNSGSAEITLKGNADIDRNIYDIDLRLRSIDWDLNNRSIHLPDGLSLKFESETQRVGLDVTAPNVSASFTSRCALDSLVGGLMSMTDSLKLQIDRRNISVDEVKRLMPPMDLSVKAKGKGMIKQVLAVAGVSVDSVDLRFSKSEKLAFDGYVRNFDFGAMRLDTVTLNMGDRGRMVDYRLHVGNQKGNLDEFAQVDLKGYIGGNRASASLTQKNIAGEVGYRLGFTAAMQDTTVSVHFTPLNATIAYMPWSLNDDNHLDYTLTSSHVDANLEAHSQDSYIKLQTVTDDKGEALQVNLSNLHIEDFLKMSALAPPIQGTVSSDMKLVFRGNSIGGKGSIGIDALTYERKKLGDFDLEFAAGMGYEGKAGARVSLLVDDKKVLTGYGLKNVADSVGNAQTRLGLKLDSFPMKIANAFLGKDVAQVAGTVSGDMTMTGSLTEPLLNGHIRFDEASVFLPIMGSSLALDSEDVPVTDNVIRFNDFKVWGANANPLVVTGDIDARKIDNIGVDLKLSAKEMQVINNDKRAKSDIYGKLFMTLDASAKGSLSALDIALTTSVLPATDVYYTIPNAQSIITEQGTSEVVKFVAFSDTTKRVEVDTESVATTSMRINANLNIVNGAKATVNLSASGADRVQLTPYGNLVYSQSYMGDMRLNGQLNLGTGFVRYTPPIMGEKLFTLEPNSYVLWNGELMNPILNIKAVNKMKASVKQDGQNSRVVNFDISLILSNTLSNMGILFDVTTGDDAAVQNELQSMSQDQRSNQAMNMLITNSYIGGAATSASAIGENALYSFLTSKLNSWAASNIRGVDLSFGIDHYDKTVDGRSSSSMSYSYQVSKSLFNNKFKIVVGGNYTTDATADENFAQNLISNISFEYMLKQTNNLSMYLKLFRHAEYESILEGEIIETGAGFVMKRRLTNLKELFDIGKKKPKSPTDSIKKDDKPTKVVVTPDSIMGDEIPESEGYDVLN